MTYSETAIKCLLLPPHPSLRDTFSPRAKALMWLHICFYERRLYGTLPGDCHGATNTVASRNDIIVQRAFYNDASAEMFRLRYASLNIFAYAHGVRRKYSGSAEDVI